MKPLTTENSTKRTARPTTALRRVETQGRCRESVKRLLLLGAVAQLCRRDLSCEPICPGCLFVCFLHFSQTVDYCRELVECLLAVLESQMHCPR
jgi:hypothetical protein